MFKTQWVNYNEVSVYSLIFNPETAFSRVHQN